RIMPLDFIFDMVVQRHAIRVLNYKCKRMRMEDKAKRLLEELHKKFPPARHAIDFPAIVPHKDGGVIAQTVVTSPSGQLRYMSWRIGDSLNGDDAGSQGQESDQRLAQRT